ncbi:unnamed protein product [Nippostrongylus brasiliensis]|uniref:Retinol dehydrogenase 10 (inferred by orthology to a human protein) n=1 Tax=Nippostrongylus brasiliensis TaxID=27835 RepID=A0A0N4YJM4_NIPBR|nr:unnamed protein product [Nippostrongylus brasiliensis]
MALAVAYDFFDAVLFNLGCRWFRKPKNIAGQVVLITGAGSGLGRKLAEYFATTKCRLVLWDIDEKGNEETKRICEEVFSEVGDVEILVNNAGIARDAGPFLDKKDEVMQKIIEVNMLSHIWMAKAFLPKMIERDRGHIVCICSLGGIVGAGLDEVAEEILYTVLTNRRIVVLPRKACILYFLKGVLPRRVFQRLLFFK